MLGTRLNEPLWRDLRVMGALEHLGRATDSMKGLDAQSDI